jgi:hypothetical protein
MAIGSKGMLGSIRGKGVPEKKDSSMDELFASEDSVPEPEEEEKDEKKKKVPFEMDPKGVKSLKKVFG